MSKKYEYISIPKNISYDLQIQCLITFINKAFKEIDLEDYYYSFEMTLFLYNCIYNSNLKVDDNTFIKHIQYIYEKLYEKKAPDDLKKKLVNDIKHIKKRKLRKRISRCYYFSARLYGFFFRQKLYIVN